MSQASHCPRCATEFVAGIAQCSDCGGPLTPGELPRAGAARPSRSAPSSTAGPVVEGPLPDHHLCTVPGEQAETIARALTFEGIVSLLVCDGMQRLRGPGHESTGPLASRRPVDVYVAAADWEEAEAVVASLDGPDLIGEQWLDEGEGDDVAAPPRRAPVVEPEPEPDVLDEEQPVVAERTAPGVWLVLVIVAALVAAFVLAL